MKALNYIFRHFSLSCVLASAFALVTVQAAANTVDGPGDSFDKLSTTIEKNTLRMGMTSIRKTSLSLDGAFKYNGNVNSDFKFTSENNVNTLNFKSVMTYKKGNVTYVLPYAVQIQQPSNLNFHKLQITLPLRKN